MLPPREQLRALEKAMAQVTIYGKTLSKAEVEAVKDLVIAAACSDGEIKVVDAVDSAAPVALNSVVLFLGTSATCLDKDLEANLVCAHASAQRAILLWPEFAKPSEPPAAVSNYCYSYLSWDAKKLAAVVADDDFTCFETALGEPVPKVPTERNLCVDVEDDVKKKAKSK
jgi:hypothetical protein